MTTDPVPLSGPVESREQPSGGFRGGQIPPYPQESASRLMAQLVVARSDLAVALAAIRELRAEAAREFESGNEWCQRAIAAEAEIKRLVTAATDDRGEDDLLWVVSESLCKRWPGEYGGPGCFVGHIDPRTVVQAVLRAALAAHLEAEQAETEEAT